MKTIAFSVLAIAAMLMPSSEALTCYSCQGDSGEINTGTAITTRNCGRPFRDDGTIATGLTTATCEGVCVTQTHYNGGSGSPATMSITRSCSDIPITDGCERAVDANSNIHWTCIKSCKTDRCNKDSGATSKLPPQLTLLVLLSALAPFLRSFTQL